MTTSTCRPCDAACIADPCPCSCHQPHEAPAPYRRTLPVDYRREASIEAGWAASLHRVAPFYDDD